MIYSRPHNQLEAKAPKSPSIAMAIGPIFYNNFNPISESQSNFSFLMFHKGTKAIKQKVFPWMFPRNCGKRWLFIAENYKTKEKQTQKRMETSRNPTWNK